MSGAAVLASEGFRVSGLGFRGLWDLEIGSYCYGMLSRLRFLLVEGDVVRASLFFDIRCMPLHTSQVFLDGNGAGSVFLVQMFGALC